MTHTARPLPHASSRAHRQGIHMPRLSVVWSDFGGVLTPPINDTFVAFATRHGLNGDDLGKVWHRMTEEMGDSPLAPLETAEWTERTWVRWMSGIVSEVTGISVDLDAF